MTERRAYFGSVGPFLFDDEDTIDHEDDGDFHGEPFKSAQTDGVFSASGTPTDPSDLSRKQDLDQQDTDLKDYTDNAIENLDGDTVDVSWSPSNYTTTSTALADHLSGIDSELATKQDTITGWTGTFTNGDGATVTVDNGIITGVA